MPQKFKDDTWIYTVITNPGQDENLLGQYDADAEISYIPFFLEKDHATQGLLQLEVERGTRCEVQALLFEDISQTARDNGFLLYLLDETGNVLDKIAPAAEK